MNFEGDIREQILRDLPYDRSDATLTEELEEKTTFELLVIFWNWLNRFVPVQKRKIHQSAELLRNQLASDPQYQSGLQKIINNVTNGIEITPHLSGGTKHGYKRTNPGAQRPHARQDLDLLLNDWGVHHLHLSEEIGANGLVKRTGPLLFAIFCNEDAYFIDIMDHKSWTREEIVHILIRNWPNAGFVKEMPFILGIEPQHTEDERQKLREAGVASMFFRYENKTYAMTSGSLSSAGTPIRLSMAANQMILATRNFQKYVETHPNYVKEALEALQINAPDMPDLRFRFLPQVGHGVIVETNTNVAFSLE